MSNYQIFSEDKTEEILENITNSKFPFLQLEIGQSFFVPGRTSQINTVNRSIKQKKMIFSQRTVTIEGVKGKLVKREK